MYTQLILNTKKVLVESRSMQEFPVQANNEAKNLKKRPHHNYAPWASFFGVFASHNSADTNKMRRHFLQAALSVSWSGAVVPILVSRRPPTLGFIKVKYLATPLQRASQWIRNPAARATPVGIVAFNVTRPGCRARNARRLAWNALTNGHSDGFKAWLSAGECRADRTTPTKRQRPLLLGNGW